MARQRFQDKMQAYPFWLVDIEPNLNPPFFALSPLMGFQSCSSVEITLNHTALRPLDRMNEVHMIDSASIGAITLRRGAVLGVYDFYRWVERHSKGIDRSRRNLLLVHFLTYGVGGIDIAGAAADAVGLDTGGFNIGTPFSDVIRPPGRAWILWDCVPTRYSSGDLDASSGDVVMHELDVQPGAVTQIDLGIV